MLPLQILPSLHFKIFYSAVQYLFILGLGLIFRENHHVLIRTAIASQIISFILCYILYLLFGTYRGFYFFETEVSENTEDVKSEENEPETITTVILAWVLIVCGGTLFVLLDAVFICRSQNLTLCHSLQGDMESLYATSVMLGMQAQIFVSSLVSFVRYASSILNGGNLTKQIIIFSLFVQSFPFYVLRSKNASDGCVTGSTYRFVFVLVLCVADLATSFYYLIYAEHKIYLSRHFLIMWFSIIGSSQLFRFCDNAQSTFDLICGIVIGVFASFSVSESKTKAKNA